MKQVLQCVAALPDDEQAYVNHHKAEASKRLIETKIKSREPSPVIPPVAQKKQPVRKPVPKPPTEVFVSPKPKPKPIPKPPMMVEPFDMGYCLPERLAVRRFAINSIDYSIGFSMAIGDKEHHKRSL